MKFILCIEFIVITLLAGTGLAVLLDAIIELFNNRRKL